MAVWRWWRFWKRPGQRAEEKDIGTNPTGVKHRSPYSCPIPALSSTISSRNHRRIPVSPPLRPFLLPSRFYSYAIAFRRFSRKAHTCLMSPYHCGSSFRVLFAALSALTVILFPSFCAPIYLLISLPLRPFPSYLFVR